MSKPDGGFTCGDIDLMNVEEGASINIGPSSGPSLRQYYAAQDTYMPTGWREAVSVHGISLPTDVSFEDGEEYQKQMLFYERDLLVAWRFHFADSMIAHEAGESDAPAG